MKKRLNLKKILKFFQFITYKKKKIKKTEYLQSFYYPFLIKKNIHNFDIIKQNQLLGSGSSWAKAFN